MWKGIAVFLAFILGGLAIGVAFIWFIEPSCSADERLDSAESLQVNGAEYDQYSLGPNIVVSLDSPRPAKKQHETTTPGEKKRWYEQGWLKKFFCEMKVGDALLAYFTFCLVVVGGFQSYYLWDSGRTAELAARAAMKSANVAEASLKDLERPWVYWNNIIPFGIFPPGAPTNLYPTAQTKHAPSVSCSLTNIGRMPAIMKASVYKLAVLREIPPVPDYSNPSHVTGKGILQVGKSTGQMVVAMEEITLSGSQWERIKTNEQFFLFFGYITYEDVFGDEYTMKFGMRHYLQGTEQGFFEFGGEAYNSQSKKKKQRD